MKIFAVDGFSPFPFIVTYFPEEIDDSNLPPHWNIVESLQLETSPTLLYDVETGMLAHIRIAYCNGNCLNT